MEFSTEELNFFNDVFTETSSEQMMSDSQHQLSIKTDVPQYLQQILVGSKLTLLAEVSHYQLWFPVSLSINKQGDFLPSLGTPEIIDVKGNERSWRVNTPKNVALVDVFHDQEIEVLSLSATGLTLKIPNSKKNVINLQQSSLEMSLAGEKPLKLELDLVRHEKDVVAAKFKDLQKGRESLRKFLFNSHKSKYSNLYQDIIL
ncbi:hypothetical protein [Colwellia psychrerythraea]|uniref:PilZ domain-containing protein n=1 Tax=Colwellia psychrerythraea TaxID=28229 RepID=A0A099KWP3_COLPS|nr:hypothetical protein [Colwellia psychrerythraea]KGJ95124.1 hypothetical protein GAB14E_1906 [Colwellia psychrerythraea]